VAPNRAFLVEWFNVPQFASTDSNTFELILFENSKQDLLPLPGGHA
jgi:hypothetical protein